MQAQVHKVVAATALPASEGAAPGSIAAAAISKAEAKVQVGRKAHYVCGMDAQAVGRILNSLHAFLLFHAHHPPTERLGGHVPVAQQRGLSIVVEQRAAATANDQAKNGLGRHRHPQTQQDPGQQQHEQQVKEKRKRRSVQKQPPGLPFAFPMSFARRACDPPPTIQCTRTPPQQSCGRAGGGGGRRRPLAASWWRRSAAFSLEGGMPISSSRHPVLRGCVPPSPGRLSTPDKAGHGMRCTCSSHLRRSRPLPPPPCPS